MKDADVCNKDFHKDVGDVGMCCQSGGARQCCTVINILGAQCDQSKQYSTNNCPQPA